MRETEDNQTGGSTPVWAGSVGECWAARGRKMNGALLSERGNSVLIRMSNPLPALSRNHFDRMVVISDLYLSYPWLLQSDPWAEWCSHHHHNIHWTDRTWLQYQPDKFQLTGPRWRSWTLLDWRRLISVTWRSWTIRMRKSVGTTTTSLYTSRVLHLGDIIVVNTNVCFHSFVVNKYIFYCLSLNYKARQVDKLRANNRHEESNIVWESSSSCTEYLPGYQSLPVLAAVSLVASLSGRTATLPRCWDEGDQGQPNRTEGTFESQ